MWLRSDGSLPLDIEFRGNVRAVKAPYAEGTDLYGTVDVTRGTVETLGRRFELERGRLTFNGPVTETDVDLSAVLDIRTSTSTGTPSVQITLDVDGRLGDDLAVTLSSNPQLDNADIVSLIATGQLAEDFIGGGAWAGAGTGLVYGQLAQAIEGLAGESLGLDVIQIDQTPGGLVIRLGKYLTNRAFISVGQPLSGSDQLNEGTQVTLEYALLRWLLGQVEYEVGTNGNSGSVGAGALYEFTY